MPRAPRPPCRPIPPLPGPNAATAGQPAGAVGQRPVRAWPRAALRGLAVAAAMIGAAGVGPISCRTGAGSTAPRVALPDPLVMPAAPPLALWVATPEAFATALARRLPGAPGPRDGAGQVLNPVLPPVLAAAVDGALDPSRPWGAVVLPDGERLAVIALRPDGLAAVKDALASLPAEGRFGAVALPTVGGGDSDSPLVPRDPTALLAWLDGDARGGPRFVVGTSLPALASGDALATAYGASPLFATLDLTHDFGTAAGFRPDLPATRLTARAPSPRELQLVLDGLRGDLPAQLDRLAPGAMGDLLVGEGFALGASVKLATSDAIVKDITGNVTAQVREQNFLVRGVLEDLARRFNSMLRTWDGAIAVAAGPRAHLRVAFGSTDPAKSEVATLQLVRGIRENLQLAASFGFGAPKIGLRERASTVGDVAIHRLRWERAIANLPRPLRPVLEPSGDLVVCIAFPRGLGTGLAVAGPDATAVLERWIAALPASAPPREALVAATIATPLDQLDGLWPNDGLESGGGLGLLEREATMPPLQLSARRVGTALVLDVRDTSP